jgi:hypothetical protein
MCRRIATQRAGTVAPANDIEANDIDDSQRTYPD